MKKTNSSLETFWKRKAGHYPLPFERKTAERTARIVRLLEGMGVIFCGRTLLDIGCGTGIYGLFLADKASKVIGVDSSGAMLARFRAQARAWKIKNAACLRKDWRSARNLPGAPFDIALASMSMAVRSTADILRMERTAGERCVYIGWAGKRKNSFMERIFSAHGLAYETPDGGGKIIKALKGLSRKAKIKFISDSWVRSGTYKDTLADTVAHLKLNNVTVRRQWLQKFIKAHIRNGRITHSTLARKVLIVWRPPLGVSRAARADA
ncbi:MAG: hypothetical protein A2021_07860 [Elusimicrobia bacterium GWF2_52_66]|nr:MAG: hypothetical protein A2X33_04475 [Elusimicrobia bacterium GWA2_51_34]OGR87328.1 MAG: hypothetical protein A2021_07860 [Elusimicrobia bacterium GWF2_52_66]HAF94913.1 hypothetical protein [Elusimicrobiota bacterium]HCE97513.1 hypothetical protein [Elusimicrobiota bacterium]